MVQDIEKFSAKLKLHPFAGQGNFFECGEIDVGEVRSKECRSGGVAQHARSGLNKAASLKEIAERLAAAQLAAADLVWTVRRRVVPSQRRPRLIDGGEEEREAGEGMHNGIHLPIPQHRVLQAIKSF